MSLNESGRRVVSREKKGGPAGRQHCLQLMAIFHCTRYYYRQGWLCFVKRHLYMWKFRRLICSFVFSYCLVLFSHRGSFVFMNKKTVFF